MQPPIGVLLNVYLPGVNAAGFNFLNLALKNFPKRAVSISTRGNSDKFRATPFITHDRK
jgi:hypothetical protein